MIPRGERICNLCDLGEPGDEFHYMFSCKHVLLVQERVKMIKKKYYVKPNAIKFDAVMNTNTKAELFKVSKFVKLILEVTGP